MLQQLRLPIHVDLEPRRSSRPLVASVALFVLDEKLLVLDVIPGADRRKGGRRCHRRRMYWRSNVLEIKCTGDQ